jgi:AraC family transcriptional regulator, regulatory protein of adaptative response / methylated-DNA-[protein]-cysteine methyltransferase
MLHIKPESTFGNDIPAADYDVIRKVIEHISLDYREQPSLEALADETGLEATALQKLFTRWAGLSPKAFLQAVTMDHARRLLDGGMPLLDAAYEVGLSGPSRLHDLFVTHEAMSPGDFKTRGGALTIRYGFHPSPFGLALIMTTDRGICGLAFASEGSEDAALQDMTRRWPAAVYVRDDAAVAGEAARVFDPSRWSAEKPLRIVLIGTDFQVRVWQSLLDVPMGKATTYGKLAAAVGSPKAARAVGAAVGANPISFVVPCHRAVGATGALTGYHWGLTRKRAMLGWEAGQVLRA